MTFEELRNLIAADQFRYLGRSGWKDFLFQWLHESGFRFTVIMRACAFLRSQKLSRYGLYHLCLLWHKHQRVKYSTYIDFSTSIGGGLYLCHPCAIVINVRTVIGRDCTLSQGVTLGVTHQRSKHPGCPVIAGGISIGHDSAIGPNSVVVKPVPQKTVVSGIPAQEISQRGSDGYVSYLTSCKKDPEES
jgi:serine O-acetyltransferase